MMKAIKTVLKFLWAIWALLFFCLTLLVVTPVFAILFLTVGQRGFRVANTFSRIWAKTLLVFIGIRVKVTGREKLDSGKPYVMIANHASQLDIPAFALATQHPFKFLAKQELTKIPLLGYIIKHLYLTVKRQSLRGRAESMKKMKEALEEGISVAIFPEGSRNRTENQLKTFYDGAFQLAIQAQADIAILTINGTNALLPADELFQFSPGKVQCHWVEVISTKGLKEADVQDLKKRAKAQMEAHLAEF